MPARESVELICITSSGSTVYSLSVLLFATQKDFPFSDFAFKLIGNEIKIVPRSPHARREYFTKHFALRVKLAGSILQNISPLRPSLYCCNHRCLTWKLAETTHRNNENVRWFGVRSGFSIIILSGVRSELPQYIFFPWFGVRHRKKTVCKSRPEPIGVRGFFMFVGRFLKILGRRERTEEEKRIL